MITNNLNTIKTFVINMDRRGDRLAEMNIPFKWERFPAFDGTKLHVPSNSKPGIIGCLKSHQALLKRIQDEKLEVAIIFEDDADLCDDFETKFNSIMNKLPEDWDLLYLGGWNRNEVKPYAEGLNIAEKVFCTHAYMIRDKFIATALEALHSRDGKYPIELKPNDYKTDVLLAECLPKGKCFICSPVLAWQREGFSDVEGIKTNNLHLR